MSSALQKIIELINAVSDGKRIPPNLRAFVIHENGWVRIQNRRLQTFDTREQIGWIKDLNFERGRILDVFGKLEFFVNQFIELQLAGTDIKKAEMLENLLENVDLFSRVRFLRDQGIIDNKLYDRLMKVKQVRNGVAHKWELDEIEYNKLPFEKQFSQFKEDMVFIWQELIAKYKVEQSGMDFDSLIKLVKEYNKPRID